MAGKQKHTPVDLTPGPLPGGVITWRCWRIRGWNDSTTPGFIDRTRISGPEEVDAQTHVRACALACMKLECGPEHVDAEPVLTSGIAKTRRITSDGILTPAKREQLRKSNGSQRR